MTRRSVGYVRYVRSKAIARKKRISQQVFGFDWYRVDGCYSKGKIHCGCGLCKPSRKFGLPTFRIKKDAEIVREAMSEFVSGVL